MAEIEITGKQIGQLDALAGIDGSEKIPVETADGNGHVTTQQMREYAQPDLSGYAKKSEVAEVKGSAVKSIMFSPGPAGNGMEVAVVRTDGSSDHDVAEIPLATTEKCGMMSKEDKKKLNILNVLEVQEDGFYIVDEALNVGMAYNGLGLDVAQLSAGFNEQVQVADLSYEVLEEN